jgi:hypothetical protein
VDKSLRAKTARDNDDRDVIEGTIPDGEADTGTSGGALGRDIGSAADLKQVDDPDGTRRANKQDDIDAGQAYRGDRRGKD